MATRTEKVTIVVDLQAPERFVDIVEQCKQAGLEVEAELEDIGLLIGSIDARHMTHLDRVPGVMSVERERTFQLPPPESEVQIDDTTAPPARRPRQHRGPREG